MLEPGLDRHDWETEYAQLEDELRSSPVEALPELYRLVERMLKERSIEIDDFVADDGIDPELRRSLTSARDVAATVDRDETVDPGDVGQAIEDLTTVYQHLLTEHSAP